LAAKVAALLEGDFVFMAVLLFVAAVVCLALFLHPYVTFPLSLMTMKRREVNIDAGAPLPSATLFFSAYNEERALPAKLANVEAIKALHPDIKVIAYSDMSSDGTSAILRSRPDLLTAVIGEERAGKATGMRKMVAMADTDICIFTDANVELEPASVARLLAYFSDPTVGGVAGTLHYVNPDDGVTASVGSLYWKLEEKIKTLESRCGSIMGADGSIFAVRRAYYPVVPPHLLDDMTVSTSMIFAGLRLINAQDVIAFEKNTTSATDEFRRKRRIACRAFNTHRFLWPQTKKLPAVDVYKYVSHKLLRWMGALFLGLAALFATLFLVVVGWWPAALVLWIGGVLAIVVGDVVKPPVLGPAVEMLRSIWATFVGVMDSFRGLTYQTWAPAKSRD